MYSIKEVYYTIQGEGFLAGKSAIFCRFSGCNLWNGLEKDRIKAICQFCDTDFYGTDGVNGGKYSAVQLVELANSLWPIGYDDYKMIVCTGGEPLLQLDAALIACLHKNGWFIAIETNGTLALPGPIDWVCVSPKHGAPVVLSKAHELKLVHPQLGQSPDDFVNFDSLHHSLQPLENEQWEANTALCVEYCKQYPKWRLCLQTHKYLGIP